MVELKESDFFKYMNDNNLVGKTNRLRALSSSTESGMPFFSLSVSYDLKPNNPNSKRSRMELGVVFIPEISTDSIVYKSSEKDAKEIGVVDNVQDEILFSLLLNQNTKIISKLDDRAIENVKELIKGDKFKSLTFDKLQSKRLDSEMDYGLYDEDVQEIDEVVDSYEPAYVNLPQKLSHIIGKEHKYIIKDDGGFITRDYSRSDNVLDALLLSEADVLAYGIENNPSNVYNLVSYLKDENYKNNSKVELGSKSKKPTM